MFRYFASSILFRATSSLRRLAVALLILAVMVVGARQGVRDLVPISTLYDTGVDNNGVPLPDQTIGDPHYTLVSVPPPSEFVPSTTTLIILDSTNDYPLNTQSYMDGTLTPDGVSTWIAPNNPESYSLPSPPDYDYQTTFSLNGLDPTTASITGQWVSDNYGVAIWLNGVNVGTLSPSPPAVPVPEMMTSIFGVGCPSPSPAASFRSQHAGLHRVQLRRISRFLHGSASRNDWDCRRRTRAWHAGPGMFRRGRTGRHRDATQTSGGLAARFTPSTIQQPAGLEWAVLLGPSPGWAARHPDSSRTRSLEPHACASSLPT